MATLPSWWAGSVERVPLSEPMGVRAAPRMYTSRCGNFADIFCGEKNVDFLL